MRGACATAVAVAAGAAGMVWAQPGSALRPVSLATFAADVKACVGETRGGAAAEERLVKAGWSRGVLSGGNSDLRFFGKDGIMAILSPDAASGRSTCVQMARFPAPVAGADVVAALTGNDPKAPTQVRVVVAPNQGKTQ